MGARRAARGALPWTTGTTKRTPRSRNEVTQFYTATPVTMLSAADTLAGHSSPGDDPWQRGAFASPIPLLVTGLILVTGLFLVTGLRPSRIGVQRLCTKNQIRLYHRYCRLLSYALCQRIARPFARRPDRHASHLRLRVFM